MFFMTLIFVGYLFIYFHIFINEIDLLPNFLGFILIAAGLSKLADESPYFSKAIPWSVSMIVLSILPHVPILFGIPLEGFVSVLVEWVGIAITLYMSYNIVAGVGDLEENKDLNLGYENLNFAWKIHALLTIICALLYYVPIDFIQTIRVVLIIINLGVNIAFLVLLFKARTRYQSAPSYNA